MQTLYNILSYLAMPWVLMRLLYKSIKYPAYRHRLLERYGFVSRMEQCIWFHAVSVGESIAAKPLIKKCLETYPNIPVLVTNMTPTGSERVQDMFGDKIKNVYVPYDIPGAVKRFLNRTQPKILVLIETELWPNLLRYTHQKKIPIVLVNARLSQKSAEGYQRFGDMTTVMLHSLRHVAVQNQEDAQRFIDLGLSEDKITVAGSVKYDVTIPPTILEKARSLKNELGDRPVWVAASTHAGEENQVLDAFDQILAALPNACLILVPRHPNRFKAVSELLAQRQHEVAKRSQTDCANQTTQVLMGDTMGEMLLFMAVADVAFIGGSFVEVGGHNSLEAAALAKPVLQGPISYNFAEITRLLKAAGALHEVQNEYALAEQVIELFNNSAKRKTMGQAGQSVVESNRGSVEKQFEVISRFV